jgi:alkylhydroperoxidase family enzyme
VITDIGRSEVSDPLYDEARAQSIDKELVDLTVAVVTINSWNRLAVTPTNLHASRHGWRRTFE